MKKQSQSYKEYQKNYQRVRDIITKSRDDNGIIDKEKAIKLSKTQCKLIKNDLKALGRARAARELGCEFIFDVFYTRAYELGSVDKVDYREYAINKLLEDFE